MESGSRRALLVLGMHRSGTSALTRVLNLLGAELGENLLPAHRDNETGFWEHREIVLLHDELLHALGQTWSTPVPLPPEQLTSAIADPFRERLRAIVERDFGSSRHFALKDPRLCRLLPLWLPLLEEMGYQVGCVLVGRHPDEVAASLKKRDSMTDSMARLLWMNHVLDAERESRGLPRAFVTYEGLLADWRGAMAPVGQALSLDWEKAIRTSGAEIDGFLDGSLRHHAVADADPEGGPWIERTWEAFRAGANGQGERAGAAMDRVTRELQTAGQLFFPVVAAVERLRHEVDTRSRQYLALRKDVEGLQDLFDGDDGAATEAEAGVVAAEAADISRDTKAAARPRAGDAANAQPGTSVVRTYETPEGSPTVSIVIPLYNQVEYTTKCLESLAEHTEDGVFEVILVDNGSTDATPGLLGCLEGNVKIIRNETNLGFATACNQGAALAGTDRVLFLNNDIEAKPGWLEPLVELLDADPSVGVVGSRLLFPDGKIQHAGVALLARTEGALPLGAFHVHYGEEGDYPEASEPMSFQVVTGACLLVRRALFEEIGGFDPYYWNGCEDVDFCLKVGAKGWKVIYEPLSELVHHESMSGPERFSRTKSNEDLLASRWFGKAEPDLIEQADGERRMAPGNRIAPYRRPGEGADDAAAADHDAAGAIAPDAAAPVADAAPDALTSIVILTRNGLDDTRLCLDSLVRHTPEPHEVIVVDNGSTDGTVEYLRERMEHHGNLRVIENATNRGFAAGNNLGLATAHGHSIVLLNNDTVVTDGWLGGLARVLRRHPECGIVGPMTNYASGPQVIGDVPYQTLGDMDSFALRWACDHSDSLPARRLVGFCWLMRRDVVTAIGGLDECFGTGNCEDDDYCLRAAQAGWKGRIATGVFIHHTGSRTFRSEQIDYRKSMETNFRIFADKWGLGPDASVDEPYPFSEMAAGPAQPRVALPEIAGTHSLSMRGRWYRSGQVAPGSEPREADAVSGALDKSTFRLAVGLLPGAEPTREVRSLFLRYGFQGDPPVWDSPAELAEQIRTKPLVLLLGPDVVVTDDALQELVSVMRSSTDVAAVGPVSNAAPAPQRDKPGYRSAGRDLRRFAARRRRRRGGRMTEVPHLGAFCLLLKSDLVQAAGGLDESGSYPDALLGLFDRIRDRGDRVVVASGAWVHHERLSEIEGAGYGLLTSATTDEDS